MLSKSLTGGWLAYGGIGHEKTISINQLIGSKLDENRAAA